MTAGESHKTGGGGGGGGEKERENLETVLADKRRNSEVRSV